MKIVKNSCFGGFGLSHDAIIRYAEIKGFPLHIEKVGVGFHYYKISADEFDKSSEQVKDETCFWDFEISRTDPALIQVVEEMGEAANGISAELEVVDIPDDVDWMIRDYDGRETICEKHRTW